MSTSIRSFVRAAAVTALVGGLALAPAYAASSPTPPTMAPGATPMAQPADGHKHHHKMPSADDMQRHVEERIKALHAKLKIMPDQEDQWKGVAEAMRDSEKSVGDLIHERHENAKTLSAVEDLESYQKIAQAHADGLQKVASAFAGLYDNMSDDQKKNADTVFGSYEGHPDRKHMPKAQ